MPVDTIEEITRGIVQCNQAVRLANSYGLTVIFLPDRRIGEDVVQRVFVRTGGCLKVVGTVRNMRDYAAIASSIEQMIPVTTA